MNLHCGAFDVRRVGLHQIQYPARSQCLFGRLFGLAVGTGSLFSANMFRQNATATLGKPQGLVKDQSLNGTADPRRHADHVVKELVFRDHFEAQDRHQEDYRPEGFLDRSRRPRLDRSQEARHQEGRKRLDESVDQSQNARRQEQRLLVAHNGLQQNEGFRVFDTVLVAVEGSLLLLFQSMTGLGAGHFVRARQRVDGVVHGSMPMTQGKGVLFGQCSIPLVLAGNDIQEWGHVAKEKPRRDRRRRFSALPAIVFATGEWIGVPEDSPEQ
mmetsp:Transcript_21838/g.60677  ORF Transcript_21838/g.60677 Transcript_21838/m.60677 type:complete len:270 (-) Transcript_21838:1143-1952(-)